jgi:hypothetical protein
MAIRRPSTMVWIVIGIVALALVTCSSDDDAAIRQNVITDIRSDARADGEAQAVTDLAGTTFSDVGDVSQCTSDCGGHDAGYSWAQDNGISSPDDCGGNSQSFTEGCEAYGREVQRRAKGEANEAEATAENNDDLLVRGRPTTNSPLRLSN